MNKAPEQMKINDALDLFEEHDAKIAFFKGRCNVDEQFGKIMRKKRLYTPTTEEDKKLVAQLGKAVDLIYERLRDKTKKQELIDLLSLREQYRPNGNPSQTETRNGDGVDSRASNNGQNGRRKENENGDSSRNSRRTSDRRTSDRRAESDGRNNTGEVASDTRRPNEDRNSARRQENRTQNDSTGGRQDGNQAKGKLKIEYTRKKGEKCAGNTVQILEIPADSKGINVPLKAGGRLKFAPPVVPLQLIQQVKMRAPHMIIPNIKRYLIIEMTPDKKTMFLNIVYGDLDLEQMESNPKYLNLCMTTILERKRINDICRNYSCVLDELVLDDRRNISLARNQASTYLVAATLLGSGDEIKTTRRKSFLDSIFGDPSKQQSDENILRIYKIGVIMVKGKECAIYSYGTKDETLDLSEGKTFEAGCFIVSGFNEERFRSDVRYRENVILNVFTPSRLKNSRRVDIAYPYIGSVTATGDFENDFEIYNELEGMQKQL